MDDASGPQSVRATLRRCPVLRACSPPRVPCRRSDLTSLGLDSRWLNAALAAGFVEQVVRGAYVDARSMDDPVAVARASALVLPQHVVRCRGLAARIHGVDPRGPAFDERPVPLTGLVPVSNRVPKWSGATIYEAPLEAHDVTEVGGVLVTTPERTALDCARYLSPPMGSGGAGPDGGSRAGRS